MKIDEKIEQFICWVEKHPNKKSQVSYLLVDFNKIRVFSDRALNWMMQICLSFYEVKNKQASWFSNRIERLYWEQWYINLNVAQHLKSHSSKSHHSKVADPRGAVAFRVWLTKSLSYFTSIVQLIHYDSLTLYLFMCLYCTFIMSRGSFGG